jgi:hypothetical protein
MDKKKIIFTEFWWGNFYKMAAWKPRRTWQDDTKIDVMEMDCEDWRQIKLPQDLVQ